MPRSEGAPGAWVLLRRGYDKKSVVALGLLVSVGALVGYRWSDLLDANGGMDWLLAGTWLWMASLLVWDVTVRRDLAMLAVGLVGGGVIEWWGTVTQIWTYFTLERPPLWILPAWPIATLAIDRMARFMNRWLDELGPRAPGPAAFWIGYWVMVPSFVIAMIGFARPTVFTGATQAVIATMVLLTLHCTTPRRDLTVFLAGSLLGVFLEYWGTSRRCWTYYTGEVPPLVACAAHGFAAIAFARGTDLVEWLLDRAHALTGNPRTPPNTGPRRAFRARRVRNEARP